MDGRSNRRNKAAFSNSPGIVWTRHKKGLLETSLDACVRRSKRLKAASGVFGVRL